MSIIVNGVSIPTNGDYIVVNGVKVEKVIANGVTVWKRETNQAKNAPPFLSAGWKTLYTRRYSFYNQIDGSYILHANFEDLGTTYIGENTIDTLMIWVGGNELDKIYLFYSTLIIDTKSYQSFIVADENSWDDDTSEGRAVVRKFAVSRFSNDGVVWTDWLDTSNTKQQYKYAQIGVLLACESDSSVEMWFRLLVTRVTFN